jgi:hypothetical protein
LPHTRHSVFSPVQFDGPLVFDTEDRVIVCDPIIEVMLDGDTEWTNLMADVLSEPGITAARGIPGTTPIDRICQPGTLQFTLNNGASNSAGIACWYSPAHPSARPGWLEGCPVRLLASYRETLYPLWRGRIRTIDPTPGRTPMRCTVLAQDAAADLSTGIPRALPPQINKSETELIQAVIDVLPAEAQPPLDLDVALDAFTFAYDQTSSDAVALSLIYDAVMSAVGTAFVNKDGTFRYRNRQNQAAAESALVIEDGDLLYSGPGFDGASSLRNVFNHFFLTLHQKTPTPAPIVLFHVDTAMPLDAGQSIEIWDEYSDPDNPQRLIGGYDFLPVVPGTDYRGNALDDGTGADRTADIAILVEGFTSTAKTTISNTSATLLYVTLRQLRGTGIFENPPMTLESFVPKRYGDRSAVVNLPFQDSVIAVQLLADQFVAQYADRARAGEELVFDPQRSATLMLGALTLDIGDVITASEVTSGVNDVDYDIRGITYTFVRVHTGAYLTVRYRIVPHVTSAPGGAAWIFDHPVHGLLDTGTVFGFA